jgi:hypothetical protein
MSSPRRDFLKELLAAGTLPDLIASPGARTTMGALLNRDAAAADTKGRELRDVRWGSNAYHAGHRPSEKNQDNDQKCAGVNASARR